MCTPSRRLLSRTFKFASSAGAIAAVLALAGTAWTGEGPKNDEMFSLNRAITITGPISGNPLISFDISWFDGDLNRYYLGDRSNKSVDVITPPSHVDQFAPGFVGARGTIHDAMDNDTGVVCGPPTGGSCVSNNDVSGPDGVLTLVNKKGEKQLWVGDGDSRVWVLNPTTGATLTPNPIPTSSGPDITILNNHHRADELCFDSADQLVMVANNADDPPFASIISTETYKVVAQIAFNGKKNAPESNNGAEQCQWSPRTGKFYISIPGIAGHPKGEGGVAVIDPKTKMVVNTFIIPVDDCAAPQGMAVGPDSQILLGCNQPSPNGHANTVIINEHTGAIVGRLPDLGGNDEVWFNPGDGHYFLAEGQLPVPPGKEQLGIVDSAGKKPDQVVPTATNPGGTTRRAHSVAADPNANEVYVPIPPNTTGFSSTLCLDSTKGCVAIFSTGPKDDHPRVVRERGPDDKQE
jgi:hypothetical protein